MYNVHVLPLVFSYTSNNCIYLYIFSFRFIYATDSLKRTRHHNQHKYKKKKEKKKILYHSNGPFLSCDFVSLLEFRHRRLSFIEAPASKDEPT